MDIKLKLVSDIYDFIDAAQKHPAGVRLRQDNYLVDGKSILGVMALDLRRPIVCITEDEVYSDFESFVDKA